MEVFAVGGCVRDVIMGREPKDLDFVVVGSTPEEMIANGFKQVGADFPVFLHPETGDEYALARTERKTAPGYNGFVCSTENVTLIDDLSRRDITINSLAVKLDDWEEFKNTKSAHLVIDPFWGQADIACGVLIHTTEAFKCDPIRVLRVARFAARYNFAVAPETMQLMSDVAHELNHVPTDRIWMEFQKGLMEDHAHKMIEVLHEVGAFDVDIMKPFQRNKIIWGKHHRVNLLRAVSHIKHLPTRFTMISADFTPEEISTHRIPNDCAEMNNIIKEFGHSLSVFHILSKSDRLHIIMDLNAMRRVEFMKQVMDIVAIIFCTENDVAKKQLFQDLKDIAQIDAAVVAENARKSFNPNDIWSLGTTIKWAVFNARLYMMDGGRIGSTNLKSPVV